MPDRSDPRGFRPRLLTIAPAGAGKGVLLSWHTCFPCTALGSRVAVFVLVTVLAVGGDDGVGMVGVRLDADWLA
jgi:hypothetical protein